MTLHSLYIEAQGCVPALLENLHGMSFSRTFWPLSGAWFQCRHGGFWKVLLAQLVKNLPRVQEFRV